MTSQQHMVRRCVRYYMNFGRAMAVLKQVLLKDGRAYDARDVPGDHQKVTADVAVVRCGATEWNSQ